MSQYRSNIQAINHAVQNALIVSSLIFEFAEIEIKENRSLKLTPQKKL